MNSKYTQLVELLETQMRMFWIGLYESVWKTNIRFSHADSPRLMTMIALIIAGEAIFSLPFHVTRFFRPTFLEVFEFSNMQFGRAPDPYGWVRQMKVDWRISSILRWIKHANTFNLEARDLFSSFELRLSGLNKTDSYLRYNFLSWGDAQMQ